ncbi:Hypothetical protein I595_1026 [Croceitalea dokdonensis DOKDO 023]|uniref:Porin n=1 Tax=Croceitalea dokdonensis DOKDO 023 TaxID=1300341 RepID=A0A0P7AL59_9FLAO|nr:putative porin [Croceitalea dokdonensis]KPM32600.1 Hypothetical protein I595_1026 [Croceitalea dokdonensis DOKDO 023]
MKGGLVIIFLLLPLLTVAQEKEPQDKKRNPGFGQKDTTLRVPRQDKLAKRKERQAKDDISIGDYVVFGHDLDATFVDTTLTIEKEYKYNFLRKDDFELMPFSNVGRPYNSLGRNLENGTMYPQLGARARHFGYLTSNDIKYYKVPTPMTELFFKTTLEQGRMLDALLTFNTTPRFNYSIAYRGFRSLGKLPFDQVESGIFRTTFNYRTKNERYVVQGHYASQDFFGQENGGLSERVVQFESGDDNFFDRSRLDVAYRNARNQVLSKRYFLNHSFDLLKVQNDSIKQRKTALTLGHQFEYESKFYQFTQEAQNGSFGDTFDSPINDKATLKTLFNQVSAQFSNTALGEIKASINTYNYQYFFNRILINDDQTITNELEGNEIAVGGDYKNSIGKLDVDGGFRYNLSGDLTGTLFDAKVNYRLNKKHTVWAAIHGSSRAPNFNFLLYQSDYRNFNWQNDAVFEKQQVQTLSAGFESKPFGDFKVKYTAVDNYTYFGIDENLRGESDFLTGIINTVVRPFQETNTITYLKLTYNKEFRYRKWALNNTIMYQNVGQDNRVMNLPDLVSRNTLYFSSDVFKKAMYLQTGVTLKYFTAYNMDGYHPLLGEFFVQNLEEQGAFPMLDVFVNAKVRQTRIYLKAEHLNTIWTNNYNFYAAPNYPYRDFVIRFGLVWNFFS